MSTTAYQLISQPIEQIPHNPDMLRRQQGRRDHRVIRTMTDEQLLLEVAGSLNSNPLLNGFSRFIVQQCDDPFTPDHSYSDSLGQGVCNLSFISEAGVTNLLRELERSAEWLEDYQDGVKLWEDWSRISSQLTLAKVELTETVKESTEIVVALHPNSSPLDCLPSYRRFINDN